MIASGVRIRDSEINPRVLLLDQHDAEAAPVLQALERAGLGATWARTGAEGLSLKASLRPHVILMDLALPDMNGMALLARLTSMRDCGVIVVSSMADAADRIVGLELGADDYMAKPPGLRELVVRIRAVHRRVSNSQVESRPASSASSIKRIGPINISSLNRRVHVLDGRRVILTSAEFNALEALASADGAPVSRDDLSKAALHRPWQPEDRSVDQLMFNLRRKLPTDESGDMLIQSIRGSGYWMRKPDTATDHALAPAEGPAGLAT